MAVKSPDFSLCGYLWRLHIYPRGHEDDTGGVSFFLNCIGTPPKDAVEFQLWVHNQQDTDKSVVHALQNYVFTGKGLGTTVFMSSDSLFEANGGFCKDEKIVIGVHISAIEMGSMRQQPVHDTVCLFAPYFDDPSTSDVVVKAGRTRIQAHKIVLAAHSALFKAMFQAGTKESTAKTVELKEIEGPVLTSLVSFMYGRPVEHAGILLPLFVAADAHQVERLRWICLQMLVSGISKKTVLEYAAVADAVTDSQLLGACMQFILDTKESYEIAEQPAMQSLMQNNTSLAQMLLVGVMKHLAATQESAQAI